MKIGIYTNYSKDKNWEVTDKVIEILKNNGFETKCFSMETAGTKGCDYSDLDSLVIIGGDGTILYNAAQCMEADIPLVTINKGTVGFLSEVHQNELDKLADLLNRKNIIVEERDMLTTNIKGKDYYALNEFMIERHSTGRIITVAVEVDGHLINEYSGDGFIVSTPTGSTGYSLSAGGSIISPKARVIALTPLNCISLTARPIIIAAYETITLTLSEAINKANIIADGRAIEPIKQGESITISFAEKTLKFLRHSEFSFYDKLIKKLT